VPGRLVTILIISLLLVAGPERSHAEETGLILPRLRYMSMTERIDTLKLSQSQIEKLRDTKPPLSGPKVAGELLLGTIAGAGAALGIGTAGGGGSVGGALVGAAIGFPLGISTGIYAVGTTEDQTGSFQATMAGTLIGTLCSAGIIASQQNRDPFIWSSLILAPIGGTIGFNLTRRYRELPSGSSDKAHLMYRQPALDLHPGLGQCLSRQAHYVNLVNVKF